MTIDDLTQWPEFGATVRATLTDPAHDEPVRFSRTGTVVQTPRSGADSLVIYMGGVPGGTYTRGGATVAPDRITIPISARERWAFEGPDEARLPIMITVLVNPNGRPDDLADVVRRALEVFGAEVLDHSFSPDPDTIADCANVPQVMVLDLGP